MAYYDDNAGDGPGRFGKNFDGPVGPRRPRMFARFKVNLTELLLVRSLKPD